jgi:hypothetical protein
LNYYTLLLCDVNKFFFLKTKWQSRYKFTYTSDIVRVRTLIMTFGLIILTIFVSFINSHTQVRELEFKLQSWRSAYQFQRFLLSWFFIPRLSSYWESLPYKLEVIWALKTTFFLNLCFTNRFSKSELTGQSIGLSIFIY